MKDYRAQERDTIFALDIGTRSIVGVVGKLSGNRFKALEIETAEHGSRAMLDGQIDNIQQVGALARAVTERLEERLGVHLERVCVAAAGRALRTQSGSFSLDLTDEKSISAETISRLEAGALSAAGGGSSGFQPDAGAHCRYECRYPDGTAAFEFGTGGHWGRHYRYCRLPGRQRHRLYHGDHCRR